MTPAEKMGLKVGDEVAITANNTSQVSADLAGQTAIFIRDDGTRLPWFSVGGGREIPIILDNVRLLSHSKQHLPPKFKLNPNGNEALSKAIQERLFELGYSWQISGNSAPFNTSALWLLGEVDKRITYGDGTSSDYPDYVYLSLDDLYRLTPTPKELPKLEIAGRTLELKDGRVVGKEFDHKLQSFKDTLRGVLSQTIGKHYLGGRGVDAATFHIGCQTVTREELQRALDWAQEVSK